MTQRKPDPLKLLHGTYRPDRASPTPPVALVDRFDMVPTPPTWLPNAHAVAEWSRLAPRLVHLGLLTEPMVTTLGHLATIHGLLVAAYEKGERPPASFFTAYSRLSSLFGLTPVDVLRLKDAAPPDPRTNRFRELKESSRSAGKVGGR